VITAGSYWTVETMKRKAPKRLAQLEAEVEMQVLNRVQGGWALVLKVCQQNDLVPVSEEEEEARAEAKIAKV
jgi:hypothetical protein